MRLWPLEILPQLPRQQLLGQHRECCALRGKGWGRKHATVDYVFKHPYWWLCLYHDEIMHEMRARGFHHDVSWRIYSWRGNEIGLDHSKFTAVGYEMPFGMSGHRYGNCPIYPEHDAAYLAECVENLRRKGVKIEIHKERKNA